MANTSLTMNKPIACYKFNGMKFNVYHKKDIPNFLCRFMQKLIGIEWTIL